MYAIRYWICESLCLVNIIAQMFFMNRFFDGEFMSYGWNIMNFSETPQDQRIDPMVFVFPRITKCIFHKYGASGSIQKHDSLCLLPLNIVNEKTYIFIWFWYIILLIMLVGLIIYRWVDSCEKHNFPNETRENKHEINFSKHSVQCDDNIHSTRSCSNFERPKSYGTTRRGIRNIETFRHRWLVAGVYARTKFGSDHLQRRASPIGWGYTRRRQER